MTDIILSSCCYNQIVYSATSWAGLTTPGTVYNISGDTTIIDGCYTVVSVGTPIITTTLIGTATIVSDCNDSSCISCCEKFVCVDVPIDTYSGYNGTYSLVGSYNAKPYWTGGTEIGYIFYDSTKWCIGETLGGNVLFFGYFPTDISCPDFSSTFYNEGACVPPVPPIPDPCGVLGFDVLLECEIPVVSPTPTPTPTPTRTPSPTPSLNTCLNFSANISIVRLTPTPTPTPSSTPPPPTPTVTVTPSADTVTFIIDDGNFVCGSVKELVDCQDGSSYYIDGDLNYNGNNIAIGTTFLASLINNNTNQVKCVTYKRNTLFSTNRNLIGVVEIIAGGCEKCLICDTCNQTSLDFILDDFLYDRGPA